MATVAVTGTHVAIIDAILMVASDDDQRLLFGDKITRSLHSRCSRRNNPTFLLAAGSCATLADEHNFQTKWCCTNWMCQSLEL